MKLPLKKFTKSQLEEFDEDALYYIASTLKLQPKVRSKKESEIEYKKNLIARIIMKYIQNKSLQKSVKVIAPITNKANNNWYIGCFDPITLNSNNKIKKDQRQLYTQIIYEKTKICISTSDFIKILQEPTNQFYEKQSNNIIRSNSFFRIPFPFNCMVESSFIDSLQFDAFNKYKLVKTDKILDSVVSVNVANLRRSIVSSFHNKNIPVYVLKKII